VTIKLENSFSVEHKRENGRSGIGLDNVRRRLAILFPGRHDISFFSENNSYLVILKLKSYQYENKMPVG
jgi:sensor histidine kinase YesM